ncbi:MAG TPA: hypothetical protein VJ697_02335 [Nitrososphaeraceae archaeon]|nr:hypothetical protein [Nitrososphaeraceae archaeon]
MLKKSKNFDSLDSRSSTLGSQANHTDSKAIEITAAMSLPNNIIDIQDNNVICEANGCYKQATNELELDVGQFGKISLFLCRNCIPKFKLGEE